MITINGKYAKAVVHTDNIEKEAIAQIQEIVDCPAFRDQAVHYMPDVHAGMNSTVGFTATLGDYVNPSHIGGDIGCTVSMMLLDKVLPKEKYAEFEHRLRKDVPMGKEIHDTTVFDEKKFMTFLTAEFNKMRQQWPERLSELPVRVTEKWISQELARLNTNPAMFYHAIGTLGGGNHMIEYDESADAQHSAVIVHCGSRNFGQKVCKHWVSVADQNQKKKNVDKDCIKELRAQFKENWKQTHWKDKTGYDEALKKFIEEQTAGVDSSIPGYLSGDDMNGYLCDLCFAQLYARWNHIVIHERVREILSKYGISLSEEIFCTHNYISPVDKIMRKGAICAAEGETIIVPFNMRDGVAVCVGKGNPDWNYSCSHGSGRSMSRNAARKNISMDEYRDAMEGIYSTCISRGTLDESPQAYKDTEEIKSLIAETCDILYVMPTKINLKAGAGDDED